MWIENSQLCLINGEHEYFKTKTALKILWGQGCKKTNTHLFHTFLNINIWSWIYFFCRTRGILYAFPKSCFQNFTKIPNKLLHEGFFNSTMIFKFSQSEVFLQKFFLKFCKISMKKFAWKWFLEKITDYQLYSNSTLIWIISS